MRDFLANLLGTYVPQTYVIGTDTIIPNGVAGLDWLYVGTLILFIVAVFELFKLIGIVLKGMFQ